MIAGIFGRTGSGKSTLFKRMIGHTRRAVVIDPLNEHEDLGACVETIEDFRDYWNANYGRERWKLVLQPVIIDPNVEPDVALAPFKAAIARKGRRFVVGVDEVDKFVSLQKRDPDISTLVNYGRHWGIHLIAVARRTQAVPSELISQCSDLYVFQMSRPGDIEYLLPYIGQDAAARVRSLDVWQCVHWNVSGAVEVVKVAPCTPASSPA